jgi:hypothetical protein
MFSLFVEVVVPKIVKPPFENHPFTGESHDLPDFPAVLRGVAVNMTAFAGRLRLKRAELPLLHAMFQQISALPADEQFYLPRLQRVRQRNRPAGMLCLAKELDKLSHNFKIGYL